MRQHCTAACEPGSQDAQQPVKSNNGTPTVGRHLGKLWGTFCKDKKSDIFVNTNSLNRFQKRGFLHWTVDEFPNAACLEINLRFEVSSQPTFLCCAFPAILAESARNPFIIQTSPQNRNNGSKGALKKLKKEKGWVQIKIWICVKKTTRSRKNLWILPPPTPKKLAMKKSGSL